MNAEQFDPKSDEYQDDWDDRVEVWRTFAHREVWLKLPPKALAVCEALGAMLNLQRDFNEWVGGSQATASEDVRTEAWGRASDLESLTCKALLEWRAGKCEQAAVIKALEACSAFYTHTMRQLVLRAV